MERPHEYAPIEWVELSEDKIPLSSLSGMDKVESDSKSAISIISYFAEWCPNCHYEAKEILKLYEKFTPSGLSITLVMDYAPKEASKAFTQLHGLTMNWVLGELHEKDEEKRNNTLFFKFRKSLNDTRNWGTPFHIIIADGNMDYIGIVKGEFIGKEIQLFLNTHL